MLTTSFKQESKAIYEITYVNLQDEIETVSFLASFSCAEEEFKKAYAKKYKKILNIKFRSFLTY